MVRASIVIVFGLLLSMGPVAFAQTPAAASSRWTVLVEAVDLPNPPLDKSECHSLQYFSENWKQFDYVGAQLNAYPADAKDNVRTRRVGVVNGFEIDEVIHEIAAGDNAPDPPPVIKLIVVERMPAEFCEVFNEENSRENVGPSYLVNVGSEAILATHDRIPGTCGCYNEAYWSFDDQGPIILRVNAYETAEKLLGPGAALDKGTQFDIQTLSFGPRHWSSTNGSSAGGYLLLTYALRDHQLVLVNQTLNAEPPSRMPAYGAPPQRIKVDGAVQAQRLTQQIQPPLPEAAQQAKNFQGASVSFHAIIGKDGSVVELAVMGCSTFPCTAQEASAGLRDMIRSGAFLLLQGRGANEIASVVRQWRYQPTMVDGYPVEVETTITVTFPPR